MTIIYFTQKSDPVYDDAGYIVGHDSVKEGYITCKDSEAGELEIRMSGDESLYNVHSQQCPEEMYIS